VICSSNFDAQMVHYAYLMGQIMYIGKLIKDQNWESLSIPKGKSEDYLQEMLKEINNYILE